MGKGYRRLAGLLGGSISGKLCDYYFINVNPDMDLDEDIGSYFVKREGNGYYRFAMNLNYARFKKDESKLSGIQARLFFATFNSIAGAGFDRYPAETYLYANASLGYSARLRDIFTLTPYVDKTSSRAIKIASALLPNGIAHFTAMLEEKGAALLIHGSLPSAKIRGFLKPFLKEDVLGLEDLLAEYITADYKSLPHF